MSTDKKQPNKKKEKITYVDDGSTIADMSGVGKRPVSRPAQPIYGKKQKRQPTTRRGSIWQTYTDAVRSMIGPMLITLGGISVIFLLVWIILGFFA